MSQRESNEGSALAPVAAASSAASSGMVMSSFSAIRARRKVRCSSSLACRRPPLRLGFRLPVVRYAFIRFTTKDTDTSTSRNARDAILAATTAHDASIAACTFFEGAGAANAAERRGLGADRWQAWAGPSPSNAASRRSAPWPHRRRSSNRRRAAGVCRAAKHRPAVRPDRTARRASRRDRSGPLSYRPSRSRFPRWKSRSGRYRSSARRGAKRGLSLGHSLARRRGVWRQDQFRVVTHRQAPGAALDCRVFVHLEHRALNLNRRDSYKAGFVIHFREEVICDAEKRSPSG
jgi:hypothetical protein